jgi:hypothetical protein
MDLIPSKVFDYSISQTVQVYNCSFIKNQGLDYGLIHVDQNSFLTITASYFRENFSLGRGGIIYAAKKNSNVVISNSVFIMNYAFQGGVRKLLDDVFR